MVVTGQLQKTLDLKYVLRSLPIHNGLYLPRINGHTSLFFAYTLLLLIPPFLLLSLNILFERAKSENVISGIKMGNDGPVISHLKFADYTIIFCKNDRQEVQSIMGILCTFQLISGLKINFAKSQLCGIGIPEEIVESYAEILGCKVIKLPTKYLGLPLGANPRRWSTWNSVIERFEKKLSSLNRKNITLGGQQTMINSNLGNLPLFYMSLFKMPISVARKLEKLQRQFLWGDTEEKRRLHMVGG
ncbi:uncharacterized protein LOC131328533 [Rhododendron vialii]|uniref:uncharacterized protein LOC131328533 n=1 Tax=Rhododendron vialii TaxID=182163 RepID=UPI00265DFD93|nr:uncharacterized protein LOC131328533 [Rhododendron vialii]